MFKFKRKTHLGKLKAVEAKQNGQYIYLKINPNDVKRRRIKPRKNLDIKYLMIQAGFTYSEYPSKCNAPIKYQILSNHTEVTEIEQKYSFLPQYNVIVDEDKKKKYEKYLPKLKRYIKAIRRANFKKGIAPLNWEQIVKHENLLGGILDITEEKSKQIPEPSNWPIIGDERLFAKMYSNK